MTKTSNAKNISYQRNMSYKSVIICAMMFFVLLLLRDTYSVGINKFVFLAIVCLCGVFMKTNHLIYLFCFLFPLYVGLPGNYMTLVLIVRLILEVRKFKLMSFILSLVIAMYLFVQNMVTGYTGIVPMMFIVGVILILLLFMNKCRLETLPMILMYSAGVAAVGLIMLLSTLRVYEFTDLLSISFRLGSSSVSYVEEGNMNVSMDPNFFGMFSIASISMAFPLIFQSHNRVITRLCLVAFVIVQLIVALIGLSRSFILVFVFWVALYILSQKKLKNAIVGLVVIVTILVILISLMPDVINMALSRFEDTDMITGNGRTTIMQEFYDEWSGSIPTMLFGVGLYNCNVHCTPLQFLFGGGLVMFVMIALLFVSYASFNLSGKKLHDFVPLIVTFIMMCTVPAAGLLNFVFPLVWIGLIMRNKETS